MILFTLAAEFFKIGFFSFGGGYATIPFLYHLSEIYSWYTLEELTQMIAIAAITPGPVGINVATYAGLQAHGIIGSLVATIFEVIPSFVLVIIISKILKEYRTNFYVKSIIETLKPISCALLLFVFIGLLKSNLHDYEGLLLLAVLVLISLKSKKDPIFYMIIAGTAGIILPLFS